MEHKFLIATDGSENALRAAEFVARLAVHVPGRKITVLVVNDMLEKMKHYSPLRSPLVFEEIEVFFREKSQEALNRTLEVFKKHQCPAEGIIKLGNPAQEVVDFAREGNYDQIIIGSRGMGGLKGIVMGSVSSKIIQLSSCPVTVVK